MPVYAWATETALSGIKLDDLALLNRHGDILAHRQTLDRAFHCFLVQFDPLGHSAPHDSFNGVCNNLNIFTFFPNFDDIAWADLIGWDIDLPAVDQKMTVSDQLARLVTRIGKTHPINDIIETLFQHHQKIGPGNPLPAVRSFKGKLELFFRKAICSFHLLLFTKLKTVIGCFPTPALAMLARRIAPPVKSTFI